VCLVFIAVPLSASIVSLRRRAGGVRDIAARLRPRPEQVRPAALICLAGAVAMVALTLATAAFAHMRIAPDIRWSGFFYGNFSVFEEQAVILTAVIFALIAAVQLASAQSLTIAVAVGAIVAALGIFALMGALTIGNCAAPFSVTYTHPPASICPGDPGFYIAQLRPAAVEAALIGILLVPAVASIAARAGSYGHRRLRARTLRWLSAGIAVVAVIAGFALRVPNASVGDALVAGNIGNDGWIPGNGYEIRLFPNWYELTPVNREYLQAEYAGTTVLLTLEAEQVGPGARIRGNGGRSFLLDGVRGLAFLHSVQWIVIHDNFGYIITFHAKSSDYAALEPDITAMLDSWHWVANS
jgi:hypothetical protein